MIQSMMKKAVLFMCLVINLHIMDAQEITTYYFIRHAEKVRSDSSNKNPSLNEVGFKRANKWQEVFFKYQIRCHLFYQLSKNTIDSRTYCRFSIASDSFV